MHSLQTDFDVISIVEKQKAHFQVSAGGRVQNGHEGDKS